MAQVQIDGPNKLITVNFGVTEIDFKTDVYSEWKRWVQITSGSESNAKYLPALRTVGGDPTIGSGSIAPYFFWLNGWRMRPHEASHTLNVEGNVAVDATDPVGGGFIVPTTGSHTVLVNSLFSNNASVISVNVGSGLSPIEQSKLDELWRLHGLDNTAPLTVTPTSRLAGAVTQSITQLGNDVTVTRT